MLGNFNKEGCLPSSRDHHKKCSEQLQKEKNKRMTCIIDKNVIDCEFRVSVIIILQGFYASDSDLNETVLQVQKKYHVIASCCYTCHINMMWSINVFLFTYKN